MMRNRYNLETLSLCQFDAGGAGRGGGAFGVKTTLKRSKNYQNPSKFYFLIQKNSKHHPRKISSYNPGLMNS